MYRGKCIDYWTINFHLKIILIPWYNTLSYLIGNKYDLLIESTGYKKMLLPDQLIAPPNMQKEIGILMLAPKTLIMEDVEIAEEKEFVEEKTRTLS